MLSPCDGWAADFAAKLPSALAGIETVGALYFLAVELTGNAWGAILSMLVLATTLAAYTAKADSFAPDKPRPWVQHSDSRTCCHHMER